MTDYNRFKIICWQRGSYSIVDTHYNIGDPRRSDGYGYNTKRRAEAVCKRKNREAEIIDYATFCLTSGRPGGRS